MLLREKIKKLKECAKSGNIIGRGSRKEGLCGLQTLWREERPPYKDNERARLMYIVHNGMAQEG